MPLKEITADPIVAPIVTGGFTVGATYATWRPRGTRDYLLILTQGGAGRFGYPGGERIATAGDLVVLRPGTPHDYRTARSASGWSLLWTHFLPRPHWMEWLSALPEVAPGIASLSLGAESSARTAVESALELMNSYANGGLARRDDFAMNALETALLHCDAANPNAAAHSKFDERVRKVMELLQGEHLSHAISLDELAQAVNLSVSRLSHLFKEQVGQTPQQFQENERIARARQLLALTSRSIATISEEVGFASPFYFTLRFKKRMGHSPRDYRRAQQDQHP